MNSFHGPQIKVHHLILCISNNYDMVQRLNLMSPNQIQSVAFKCGSIQCHRLVGFSNQCCVSDWPISKSIDLIGWHRYQIGTLSFHSKWVLWNFSSLPLYLWVDYYEKYEDITWVGVSSKATLGQLVIENYNKDLK